MAQYLCIIRGGDDKLAELSESERNSHMQDWFAWVEKLTKDGSYQEGNPLDASHKIMRKKGSEIIFDGPYTESKEIVGGYMILNAESLDKACEISKDCPVFDVDGSIEVAQIIPVEEE